MRNCLSEEKMLPYKQTNTKTKNNKKTKTKQKMVNDSASSARPDADICDGCDGCDSCDSCAISSLSTFDPPAGCQFADTVVHFIHHLLNSPALITCAAGEAFHHIFCTAFLRWNRLFPA